MIKFSPSLLAADFSQLSEEVEKISAAEYLHLDVMDGFFVPNITFGPGLIKALRPHSNLKFDTHLMIEKPERYIEDFAKAGSDLITVHQETSAHIHRTIQQIKAAGCQAGCALNPATPIAELEYLLPELDLVLLMTVNPGFGGQSFIDIMYEKIKRLKKIIDKHNYPIKIQVDGGIKPANLEKVVAAGAEIIVAGSAIFGQEDPAQALKEMRNLVS